MPDLSDLEGLLWYAECKAQALARIEAFVPPAPPIEMRLHHGLYAINALALLDRASEIFGRGIVAAWEGGLDGLGGHAGQDNARYLRELRNAVIHRGADLTCRGDVIDGRVRALAPVNLPTRGGGEQIFQPFEHLLIDVFKGCESALQQAVSSAVLEELNQLERVPTSRLRIEFEEGLELAHDTPPMVKELARRHVNDDMLLKARQAMLNRVRTAFA